ncbi:MAG: helix-turn-helix transcriptional regulator [Bacteroidales bacterium]|nr:helix-turn-helix transcriptional regulator [Bacteroidales bacterium]
MFTFKDILHIIPVFLAIFFAFQLLTYRSVKAGANKVLGMFMAIISLHLLFDVFYYLRYYNFVVYFRYYVVMPLILSIIPLLYLYIKTLTTENYKFLKKDFKHFIPSFLILVLNIVFYGFLFTNEEKFNFVVNNYLFNFATGDFIIKANFILKDFSESLYFIQLVSYIIMMFILFKRHRNNIQKYFSYKEKISLTWLKVYIYIFIALSVFDLLETIFFVKNYEVWEKMWELIDGIIGILYVGFLGYFGIKQTDIYAREIAPGTKELNFIPSQEIINSDKSVKELNLEKKYISSSLSDEQKKEMITGVVELMEKEKIFLNNKLTIDDLAVQLNTNKKYLSQVINELLKKNFYNLVNEYRVKEAQKLLLDTGYENLSVEGIATTVGFNSKSSFHSAFKNFLAVTPSQYQKSQKIYIS